MTDAHLPSDDPREFDRFWKFQDPAGTEAQFIALRPHVAALGDPAIEAELLTQIARTHSLRKQFDRAHEFLDEAETLAPPGDSRARLRIALERGRAHNSNGDRVRAGEFFRMAFSMGERLGNEPALTIDAAHMLGISEPSDSALEWNSRAIVLAEATDDVRAKRWLGPLYNNTGWTYHERGEFETALDLFQRGAKFHREHGNTGPRRIAEYTVGRALRSLERYDDALEIQRRVEAEIGADESAAPDGFVLEEIGECLLALGRSAEARPYFAKAHDLLAETWLASEEPERIDRLLQLSKD